MQVNKKIKIGLLVGAFSAIGFLVSCGGSTNNDQGVSFTLLGFRSSCSGEGDDITTPNLSGMTAALDLSSTDETPGSSGDVIVGLVLENNLSTQFVRAQRAFISYTIPGSSVQPPSTSVPISAFLDKAGGTPGSGGTSATPTSGSSGDSKACAEFQIVPAEIRQWLVLNRNSLPELPFGMEASLYVTGLSSAGDRFDSNENALAIRFTPNIVIPPDAVTPTPGGSESTDAGTDSSGTATDSDSDGSADGEAGGTGDTDTSGTDDGSGANL
jgi:hypothetical protein